jgi:hypothetical protein
MPEKKYLYGASVIIGKLMGPKPKLHDTSLIFLRLHSGRDYHHVLKGT